MYAVSRMDEIVCTFAREIEYFNHIRKFASMIITNPTELYQALSDPTNAGSTLELMPGRYPLSEVTGVTWMGRIEFLKDMTIRGTVNDATQVVIDASRLPGASFRPASLFPMRTGAIRMGNGNNKLEWITVIGSSTTDSLSVIDTDLITPNQPSHIEIRHCIVSGGRIGINIRNVGEPSNNRIVHARIEHNEITRNEVSAPGTQQGQGIIIQHANGVSSGHLHVHMKKNNVHHNTIGLKIFNNSTNQLTDTSNNNTNVNSDEDQFDNNLLGIHMQGSTNGVTATSMENNAISLDARKSTIRGNKGIKKDSILLTCGIFLTAGTRPRTGSPTSGNAVVIKLKDCIFSNNEDFDIRAFGAFTSTDKPPGESTDPQPIPGEHNIVTIKLKGESEAATLWTMNTYPADPASTNKVEVKVEGSI